MNTVNFFKMQASGNDYVFIDERENYFSDYSSLSEKISDRHFGAGSDGLIVLGETDEADVRMTVYNSDGTRGEICGNALRCIGKYLFDNKIKRSEKSGKKPITPVFRVLTDAGVKTITPDECGKIFTVAMGKVSFRNENLPSVGIFLFPFSGKEYLFSSAFIGNPHAVCVVDNFDFDYFGIANEMVKTGIFPNGANVEFVKIDDNDVKMRVIERGSGETLCCGSGSCAVAGVLCRAGLKNFGKIKISSRGGSVLADIKGDYSVSLSGDASFVYEGKYFLDE